MSDAGRGKRRGLGFTGKVVLGLLAGVACGLLFGEHVAWMKVAGDAFVGLLQMTVLPYIMVALVTNVGRLTWAGGRRLILRGLYALLVLWAVGLLALVFMPLALPEWSTASFFSTSLVEPPPQVDFLDLFIPVNIFGSLARSVVPAIVVFCLCLGGALMGMKNKEGVLSVLDALAVSLMRVNAFVVRLTPYGVFAIAASVAGTMTVAELGRLQAYLVVLTAATVFLTFLVLPLLVSALTPFSYRDVMRASKDALVTAFATGKVLVVLPMLVERTKTLFEEHARGREDVGQAVDVMYPLAYPFPTIGKVLTLFFVPFAAWFVGAGMSLWEAPAFLTVGLFSLFGGPVLAMPFLLDFQRLPSDMFQLFLAPGVYTARLGDLAAAMHLVVLVVLTTSATAGLLRVQGHRILRWLLTSVGLACLVTIGVRAYLSAALVRSGDEVSIVDRMDLAAVRERFLREYEVLDAATPNPRPLEEGEDHLDRIHARGVVRVGFRPEALPWCYRNVRGELVGFDVDMAHRLATDLDVAIEFVPVDAGRLEEHLAEDHVDIVMAGLPGLLSVVERMTVSHPYLDLHLALLVRDYRRHDFRSMDAIDALERVRLATVMDDAFLRRLIALHSNVEVVPVDRLTDVLEGRVEVDAALVSAEGGSAWTLRYPGFSVVTPAMPPPRVPLVYALPSGDVRLQRLVDRWIDLRERDGTIGILYDHWILGKNAESRGPRWCVLRDVLHWIE